MKKYLWLLVTILAVVGAYVLFAPKPERKVLGTESSSSSAPASLYPNLVNLELNGKTISAIWYRVEDPFNLELIANFDDRENASEVFESRSCKVLVNAGFYTKDSKPAGFYSSEGLTLRNYSKNNLFDGVLSVNYLGTPMITTVVPENGVRVGVQTGPVIKENASYRKLVIANDKESRRVIAGVTGYNDLYFVVFYNTNSAYLGPKLEDMPEMLKLFEKESGIEFADAINLDGGTASAFYAPGFNLSELSPVGAFFCEK